MMKLISFFIFTVLSLGPTGAWAGAVTNALRDRDVAYKNYYEGVKKLGPNPTSEQVAQVHARTVQPAVLTYSKAIDDTAQAKVKEGREEVYKILTKKLAKKIIPKNILVLLGMSSDSSSGNSTAEKKIPAAQAPVSPALPAPQEAGPGLDGSKFLKEIEFQKRKAGQATPAPTEPEAGPGVQVDGHGKVDVIEFSGPRVHPVPPAKAMPQFKPQSKP